MQWIAFRCLASRVVAIIVSLIKRSKVRSSMVRSKRLTICAINGSSRTNGLTARVLAAILRDADRLGSRTRLLHLARHRLAPCDGSQQPQMRADLIPIMDAL